MEQDKFIQQLRDKLDGFEMDVPEGLWENIEAALQKQGVLPVSEPRHTRQSRFITLRHWAVAASVVACLVGGGYWWWSRHHVEGAPDSIQPPEKAVATVTTVTAETAETAKTAETAETTKTTEAVKAVKTSPNPSYRRGMEVPSPEETSPTLSSRRETEVNPAVAISLPKEEPEEITPPTPKRRKQPYISIYSGNGIDNYLSSNGVEMAEQKANSYHALYASNTHATRSRDIIYLASYEERQKHDHPIAVGLSLSYPLSNRISVTSGAVVTWLHSEFENIIRDQTITRNQQLVYFGIPLSMNYRFWQYKGLKLYALAGGQADWNVSVDTNTDGVKQEINKDRMQWSVHAGAGIEFCPIPQLGLYVEPGVKYYFDNGSNILNYFKDKPLNYNVQFGLRLNMWNL